MLNSLAVRLSLVSFLSSLLVLAAACASNDGDPHQPDPASPEPPVASPSGTGEAGNAGSTGLIPGPGLASIRSLVEATQVILIGTVSPGEEVFQQEQYPGSPCTIPYTIYPVRVDKVVYAPSLAADEIKVAVFGGPGRNDSCPSPYDGFYDHPRPLLLAGTRYLFFVNDDTPSGFPGWRGEIWALTPTGLLVPNGTEEFNPGFADLVGVTAEEVRTALQAPDRETALRSLANVSEAEATEKILKAVAQGPLPDVPAWLGPLDPTDPTATPAPSPAPTPSPAPAPPAEDAGAIEPGPAAE